MTQAATPCEYARRRAPTSASWRIARVTFFRRDLAVQRRPRCPIAWRDLHHLRQAQPGPFALLPGVRAEARASWRRRGWQLARPPANAPTRPPPPAAPDARGPMPSSRAPSPRPFAVTAGSRPALRSRRQPARARRPPPPAARGRSRRPLACPLCGNPQPAEPALLRDVRAPARPAQFAAADASRALAPAGPAAARGRRSRPTPPRGTPRWGSLGALPPELVTPLTLRPPSPEPPSRARRSRRLPRRASSTSGRRRPRRCYVSALAAAAAPTRSPTLSLLRRFARGSPVVFSRPAPPPGPAPTASRFHRRRRASAPPIAAPPARPRPSPPPTRGRSWRGSRPPPGPQLAHGSCSSRGTAVKGRAILSARPSTSAGTRGHYPRRHRYDLRVMPGSGACGGLLPEDLGSTNGSTCVSFRLRPAPPSGERVGAPGARTKRGGQKRGGGVRSTPSWTKICSWWDNRC